MTTVSRSILLRGDGYKKEGVAGAAVTPGHFVSLASTGKYVVHPTAGGAGDGLFAMQPEWSGNNSTLDTAYALNDQILMIAPDTGAEIYALLAPSAAAVAVGDKLESAGNGTLRKITDKATITDSTGGTPSTTFAAITAGGTYAQADIVALKNAISEVAALFNGMGPYGSKNVVAVALEAVDNSANAATSVRIRVSIR